MCSVYIECSVMVGGGGQLKLHDPVSGHLLAQLLLAGGGRSLATCSPITVRADTLQNEHIFTQRPNCLGQKGVKIIGKVRCVVLLRSCDVYGCERLMLIFSIMS
jgi:hypothetical protein